MTTAPKKAPAKKPAAKAAAAPAETKSAPAAKPAETEAPAIASAFALPAFEMPEQLVPEGAKEFAEKSIASMRDTFEKTSATIQEQNAAIEKSFDTATANVKELNKKAAEATKSNMEAGFSFFTDLMAVKSLSEVIELQTSFAAKQFDAMTAQGKEMQDAITKGFEETTAPVKEAAEKAIESIKAA